MWRINREVVSIANEQVDNKSSIRDKFENMKPRKKLYRIVSEGRE